MQCVCAILAMVSKTNWILDLIFCFLSTFFFICFPINSINLLIESATSCYCRRLRSYRYIWADWKGRIGIQCSRHWAPSLVWHVGLTETSDCTMAYTEGSRGWRKERLSTYYEEIGQPIISNKNNNHRDYHQTKWVNAILPFQSMIDQN